MFREKLGIKLVRIVKGDLPIKKPMMPLACPDLELFHSVSLAT